MANPPPVSSSPLRRASPPPPNTTPSKRSQREWPPSHDTAEMMLEFILREPVDDWVAHWCLSFIPITPPFDTHLKKAILLRRLRTDLVKSSVTTRTLETLEILQRHGRLSGEDSPSISMQDAYLLSAVELTCRPLRRPNTSLDAKLRGFKAAFHMIWGVHIKKIEESDAAPLVSGRIKPWLRMMLDGTIYLDELRKLSNMDTREKALEAINRYLKEAYGMRVPLLIQAFMPVPDVQDAQDEGPAQDDGKKRACPVHEAPAAQDDGTAVNRQGDNACGEGSGAGAIPNRVIYQGRAISLPKPPKKERKMQKFWTVEEENALIEAVRMHGVGNWTEILYRNREAFKDRTGVNLKDKWRNMNR